MLRNGSKTRQHEHLAMGVFFYQSDRDTSDVTVHCHTEFQKTCSRKWSKQSIKKKKKTWNFLPWSTSLSEDLSFVRKLSSIEFCIMWDLEGRRHSKI